MHASHPAGNSTRSPLDNFAWAYGCDGRFGLVHVGYATRRRTTGSSGRRHAELMCETSCGRPREAA
ncbi:family 1 glycosylhydrolase [Streptomyces argenteolus]|uniref:family 1 glycosylhydrolase n=1 Tax=Streptomyces sp. NPDC025273 TaxID=3155251 RepID=UPI00340E25FB